VRYDPTFRTHDNSDGLRTFRASKGGEQRTIRLSFMALGDGIHVRASGSAIDAHGPDPYEGLLPETVTTVSGWGDRLRRVWTGAVVRYQDPRKLLAAHGGFPFADTVDLRGTDEASRRKMWARLAYEGWLVFNQLFPKDNADLRRVGERLRDALLDRPQVISVDAGGLTIPWQLLFVSDKRLYGHETDAFTRRAGFIGYRHLIETVIRVQKRLEPEIRIDGRAHGSAIVDHTIDNHHPTVAPILGLLKRRTNFGGAYDSPPALLTAIQRRELADRHLLYLCCHNDDDPDDPAGSRLRFLDDEGVESYVTSRDWTAWLEEHPLEGSPVVFLNTCRGGSVTSGAIASTMLKYGGNCLLGPQIVMPMPFARAFGGGFIFWMTAPRKPAGRVVRHLVQHYADKFENPLGLAYSLYRGIDSIFWPLEG
jgi:hypothetical protein